MERATAKLEKAASDAYDLINGYAEKDPRSDDDDPENNPWNNPEQMHSKLDIARRELTKAWEDLKLEHQKNNNDNDITTAQLKESKDEEEVNKLDPDEFRALYMDMITDAFADSLESMRQQQNQQEIDVDVLVDCLQSGIELLDSAERGDDGFFRSLEVEEEEDEGDDVDDNENEKLPTIHQLRQIEVGYKHVSVSS